MGKLRTFRLDFSRPGKVQITVPGAEDNTDSQALAKLTEALGKKLGKIEERHIGRWEGGVHTHADGTTHRHHHGHSH